MLLVRNLPLVGVWVKLLKVPKAHLYAGILIFATVGVYGMRQSAFELYLLYAIGLLGLVMQRFDFPAAPVVIGMILGPLAEAQLRNALAIGEGRWSVVGAGGTAGLGGALGTDRRRAGAAPASHTVAETPAFARAGRRA